MCGILTLLLPCLLCYVYDVDTEATVCVHSTDMIRYWYDILIKSYKTPFYGDRAWQG